MERGFGSMSTQPPACGPLPRIAQHKETRAASHPATLDTLTVTDYSERSQPRQQETRRVQRGVKYNRRNDAMRAIKERSQHEG